jgi:deoxyribodipyrimidine photo-lyase
MKRILVWFRRDLRVTDHPALHHAAREAEEVIPFYCFDPAVLQAPGMGAPRAAFLLASLESLGANLAHLGGRLILRSGPPAEEIPRLLRETKAEAVFWNTDIEPSARALDAVLAKKCVALGAAVRCFDAELLHAPGTVLKGDGLPYTVFTPFAKTWGTVPVSVPLPKPKRLVTPAKLTSDPLPPLKKLGFVLEVPLPPAGEKAALDRMKEFMKGAAARYEKERDLPALEGTSRLSVHLRFGTISPRTVLMAARDAMEKNPKAKQEIGTFVKELVWRDFYKTILWFFPHVEKGAFKKNLDGLAWENDERLFRAWCEGRTGFPIVDAAMRQLNRTGWMHNRLRMITASFLTKDLLVDWRKGERYFMEKLFDGDLASNNGGWQWSASTGTDAQPWFRIFNPSSQAMRFDPKGEFIKKWVPEAESLTYPPPIVDHARQRAKALALFKRIG